MRLNRASWSRDTLPFVKNRVIEWEGAEVNGIVARWANGNHMDFVMGPINGPLANVVNVTTPVRAAGVCAFVASLSHELLLSGVADFRSVDSHLNV